jgi:predicted nucleotidyltransferase
MYGERLSRVVLFGSRARGDHQADSDYDIAVFLRQMPNRSDEIRRIADIETEILYDTGAVINALPFPESAESEATAFMHELMRDGREI